MRLRPDCAVLAYLISARSFGKTLTILDDAQLAWSVDEDYTHALLACPAFLLTKEEQWLPAYAQDCKRTRTRIELVSTSRQKGVRYLGTYDVVPQGMADKSRFEQLPQAVSTNYLVAEAAIRQLVQVQASVIDTTSSKRAQYSILGKQIPELYKSGDLAAYITELRRVGYSRAVERVLHQCEESSG